MQINLWVRLHVGFSGSDKSKFLYNDADVMYVADKCIEYKNPIEYTGEIFWLIESCLYRATSPGTRVE